MLLTGGTFNYSARSVIFRFLAYGKSIEIHECIDNDFLKYMQQYVFAMIEVSKIPFDQKETRDNAFKLLQEGYERYIEFTQNRLGIRFYH